MEKWEGFVRGSDVEVFQKLIELLLSLFHYFCIKQKYIEIKIIPISSTLKKTRRNKEREKKRGREMLELLTVRIKTYAATNLNNLFRECMKVTHTVVGVLHNILHKKKKVRNRTIIEYYFKFVF